MNLRDAPLTEPSCNSNWQKKIQASSALAGVTRHPTCAARN
ncbi:hypothetical protein A2U01_0095971 [Trifolium medium]|uniref:Uncharacterized protein n=1 Tax=Trifolium medium TaxID=97028 RepID=A0A392UPN4_9FABA|nr:hypothetical protein [Trifolium medium]